ncbi:MAG: hypothetical protein ACYDGR_03330 [Candidatus Dormibacteria bacterium]
MERGYDTMTRSSRAQRASLATIGLAVLGTVDVGSFIAADPAVALKTQGRAAGSLTGLALWVGLLAAATLYHRRPASPALGRATLGFAAVVATGSVGLAAIHVAAHAGAVRAVFGGALGVAALGAAWLARDRAST